MYYLLIGFVYGEKKTLIVDACKRAQQECVRDCVGVAVGVLRLSVLVVFMHLLVRLSLNFVRTYFQSQSKGITT